MFWCAGFYTVADGLIQDAVEYWVTQDSEEPPARRVPYAS